MDLERFRGLRPPLQIALVVAPGLILVVAGLVVLGGVATGIGAVLVIVALLLWPLMTAGDDAAA